MTATVKMWRHLASASRVQRRWRRGGGAAARLGEGPAVPGLRDELGAPQHRVLADGLDERGARERRAGRRPRPVLHPPCAARTPASPDHHLTTHQLTTHHLTSPLSTTGTSEVGQTAGYRAFRQPCLSGEHRSCRHRWGAKARCTGLRSSPNSKSPTLTLNPAVQAALANQSHPSGGPTASRGCIPAGCRRGVLTGLLGA